MKNPITALRHYYERWLVKKYHALRSKKPFVRATSTCEVKKGKRKYTLLFIEMADGKHYRVNIGRHQWREVAHGVHAAPPILLQE